LSTLASNEIEISARMNGQNLGTLFEEVSIEALLRFIELTTVDMRREAYDAQRGDKWDVGLRERGGGKD
jgi:hypothetical protein